MNILHELHASRWGEYRDLRMQAVKTDPLAFSVSIADYEKYTDTEWKDELQRVSEGPRMLFCVEIDGRLVGMCSVSRYTKPPFKHNAFLTALFVSPEHRGEGIGKALIHACIDALRADGSVENLLSEIYSSQEASIRLHEHCGFERVGVAKRFVRSTEDGLYYDKYEFQKTISTP